MLSKFREWAKRAARAALLPKEVRLDMLRAGEVPDEEVVRAIYGVPPHFTYDLSVNDTNQVAGKNYPNQTTIAAQDIVGIETLIPVAQPGVMTTHTSTTAGTLTMTNSDHGITTGVFIDIYWTNTDGSPGQLRNATVGTVAGTSVPFTLATGDNVPPATTEIIAALVNSFPLAMVGNDLLGLVGAMDPGDNGGGYGTMTLLDTGGTVEDLFMGKMTPLNSYRWIGDFTNPLAGKTIDTVHMSHNNLVTPVNMRVAGLLN